MILIVDNRDSFVFNLDQGLRALGATTRVVRSDRTTAGEALTQPLEALVLSPGPGRPEEAGCLLELVRRAPVELPILGVCLGHQAMIEAEGGLIVQSREVVHGRCSEIRHDGRGLFAGLSSPLTACRYHSLTADPETLPSCFAPSAWTTDAGGAEVLMGIRDRKRPRFGLQFHPESFRTPRGPEIIARFLAIVRGEAA